MTGSWDGVGGRSEVGDLEVEMVSRVEGPGTDSDMIGSPDGRSRDGVGGVVDAVDNCCSEKDDATGREFDEDEASVTIARA